MNEYFIEFLNDRVKERNVDFSCFKSIKNTSIWKYPLVKLLEDSGISIEQSTLYRIALPFRETGVSSG